MRIIAGKFGSRRLKGVPPPGLRPTSDKLRETLFNIIGPAVAGADFLDACAGIGGMGIEALSRGAQSVHFIDSSRTSCALIRANLEALQIQSGVRVHEMEMRRALQVLVRDGLSFDIAFLDPPYDREDLYTMALKLFGERPLLKEDGILVIEHSKRDELSEIAGFLRRYRVLQQGDSCLSFYRKDA